MKRLLSLATLLLMAITSFAHDFEVGGIYYKITSSSSDSPTVSVSYKGTSYDSYSNEYTGNVTILETVTYSGKTYSVTSIDNSAFYGCSGLTSVTIPNSVTTIGSRAFWDCSGLTSITIPNSVTSIGSEAFEWCSGLTSITIPNSVTSIGSSAFERCSGLTSITIGNSISNIDYDVFNWCTGLTSIKVDAENTVYDSRGNCNAIIETSTNTLIRGCKTTTIPSSVTSIGSEAFYGCTGLTSITIPSSVTSIGSEAFRYCEGLTSINIPSSVTSIGSDAFYYCTDTKFYVDKNTIALFVLWRQILDKPKTGYPKYASENVYDINTGEKIELFKTTASSVRVVSPEPKNYTITSQSLTIDGKSVESPYYAGGLSPNTDSNVSLTIKYKDAEGSENTFYTTQTVKTKELILTTEQPKVVSMGNVVVSATTNVDADEKNVGFEWRRTDWTSDFASNSGSAVVYGNTMEGYIRNMNTDKLWKYRAYYLSDDGTYYYGDWVGLDASNTSYFEPTVHTYADISTSGKVALIRGYVLNGTDKVTVQGFKYWKTANKSNSLDIAMEAKPQAAVVSVPAYAITETVAIVGAGQQMMNATLENLDYGSTYQCVAFATTSENETFYGEVQTFTTEAAPTGIEGVKEDAGSSKPVIVVACYDINGKQLSAPQKGLNIIKMSDGTTRKVVR